MTTTTDTAAPAADLITQIPLDQLHESPFNPRKTFRAVDELAADIKAQGRVLQPLLVRPRLTNPLRDDVIDGYEIVFGHRRFRAAEVAGLASVPCMVRALSHEEARRAQISENLQRDDMDALEEAEGLHALQADYGYTIEQLMQASGKSRTGVYNALKLLELCTPARHALLAGQMGAETAVLIARIPGEKLQTKALQAIRDKNLQLNDGGKGSYRQIRDLLVEQFSLDLRDALFDTADALLLPDAGPCTGCPKRSGNAPELFADMLAKPAEDAGAMNYRALFYGKKGPDLCTDPDCFAAKKKQHLANEAARLEADGKAVVAGTAAKAALDAGGNVKCPYVAAAHVKAEVAKLRKAAARGGQAAPQPVLIQDPRNGRTVEAFKRSDLQQAGVATFVTTAGQRLAAQAAKPRDFAAERAEADAKAKQTTEARVRLLQAVRERVKARQRGTDDLRLLLRYMLEMVDGEEEVQLARLWGHDGTAALREALPTLPADSLACMLLDVAMSQHVWVEAFDMGEEPEFLHEAARAYGVDAAAVLAPPVEPAVAAPVSAGAPGPAALPTPSKAARAPKLAAKGKPGAKHAGPGYKYRCPLTGSTWTGRGLKPAWVRAALANGSSLDDLLIGGPGPKPARPAGTSQTDDDGCAVDRDPNTADMFERVPA